MPAENKYITTSTNEFEFGRIISQRTVFAIPYFQREYVWNKRHLEDFQKDIDYLVDDSPQNWHAWRKGRGDDREFILVDAAYNKHIPAKNRIFKLTETWEKVV